MAEQVANAATGGVEPQPSTDDVADVLAGTALFSGLAKADLQALAATCVCRELQPGEWCVRRNEPGDALYVVAHGRLRVVPEIGPERELRTGDVFGEMALLTGGLRSADVRAVRDSQVVALPADAFNRVVEERPAVLRRVAEVVVHWLESDEQAGRRRQEPVLALAIVPVAVDRALAEWSVGGLADALSRYGPTVVARAQDGPAGSRGAWASSLEATNRSVCYLADEDDFRAWANRQADRIVLVVEADGAVSHIERIRQELARVPLTPLHLVLLHRPAASRPAGTARWLRALGPDQGRTTIHHARVQRPQDLARIVRLLSGRGVGLVLGGGGPRGLAHLGVLRALEEAGVPLDTIGGTSIGALIGSTLAMDFDRAAREDEVLRALTESGSLFRPTLPLLALTSGARIRRLLEATYDAMGVEDCWLPFFCVSASLTRAQPVIHEQGSLAQAVRASLSLPGFLPPVRFGNDLLVDGGVLNNLPVDIMRSRVAGGAVAAVDVGVDVEMQAPADYEETPSGWRLLLRRVRGGSGAAELNLLSIVLRAKELASMAGQRRLSLDHRADLELRPPVALCGALDFRAARHLIDDGYRYAAQELDRSGWAGRSW